MSAWEVTGAMRKLTVSTIEGATAAHVVQATKATDIPHAEVCVCMKQCICNVLPYIRTGM